MLSEKSDKKNPPIFISFILDYKSAESTEFPDKPVVNRVVGNICDKKVASNSTFAQFNPDILESESSIQSVINDLKSAIKALKEANGSDFELKLNIVDEETIKILMNISFIEPFYANDLLEIFSFLIAHSPKDSQSLVQHSFIDWCFVFLNDPMLLPFYSNLYHLLISAFLNKRIDIETFYDYQNIDEFANLICNMVLNPESIKTSEKSVIIGDELNFKIRQEIRIRAMELLSQIINDEFQPRIDYDAITEFLIVLIMDEQLINDNFELSYQAFVLMDRFIDLDVCDEDKIMNETFLGRIAKMIKNIFNENEYDKKLIPILMSIAHLVVSKNSDNQEPLLNAGFFEAFLVLYFKNYDVISDLSLLLSSGINKYIESYFYQSFSDFIQRKNDPKIYPLIAIFFENISNEVIAQFFDKYGYEILNDMTDSLGATLSEWEKKQIIMGIAKVFEYFTANQKIEEVSQIVDFESMLEVFDELFGTIDDECDGILSSIQNKLSIE